MKQFSGDLTNTDNANTEIESGNDSLTSLPVSSVSLEQRFASVNLQQLGMEYDPSLKTLWVAMKPEGRPCFSPSFLSQLARAQVEIKGLYQAYASQTPNPIHYKVIGSGVPGVYNLGGDLDLFVRLVSQKDREALLKYATDCIDVIYGNYVALDLPVVTIALVQGDALGGGFETALSCDVIIAEKQAKFGLPEILFNLFPGMGAYSFLARRINGTVAEELITSGQLYSAEQLLDMGIVDVVAEPGEGRQAATEYIQRNSRKYNAHSAIYRTGRRVQPLHYSELQEVVELWVEAALSLTDADMRKMQRLTRAQNRFNTADVQAAAL